mgnify:CR=1 FL=1
MDLFEFESKASHQGFKNIAGIDEAGRGPLAGPVVAAAVIFPSKVNIPGLNDSNPNGFKCKVSNWQCTGLQIRSQGVLSFLS